MSFTKNIVIFGFCVVLALLLMWWSGFLEDVGMGGPLDALEQMLSLIPNWLIAGAVLFVAGGIVIERYFD